MSFWKELLEREALAVRNVSELRYYQHDVIVPFLLDLPFSAAYVDMGLGKTVSVLTVLQRLFTRGKIEKCLIIAPLRVARMTWPAEINAWSHTWWMSHTLIRADERHPDLLAAVRAARASANIDAFSDKGASSQKNSAGSKAKTAHIEKQKQDLARSPAMIHVINREAVEWLVAFWGKNWPYDCVIIDESTSFSDHSTKRWKALVKMLPKIKRMHLLSGIPAPEGIADYFAQIYLLDRGERFGRSITRFRETYMIHRPYEYRWVPRPGSDKLIADAIADICLVMKEEDYLPRTAPILIEHKIVLEPAELRLYRSFERTSILSLPEAEIEAETGSVLAQKLLQMASGAVLDENKKWHRIHDHKLLALRQIREEAQGSPLLVAYWHRASLSRIQAEFPKAVKMDREGKCVTDWNAGKIDMLLIHPRSAGHGLNMQLGPGHNLIWFDNPLPYEDYAQTIKRLDRSGQRRTVRVHHLVAQGTVDAKVLPVLQNKNDAQDVVKRYIRDLRNQWSQTSDQK